MKLNLYCSVHKNMDFKNKADAGMYGPKETVRGIYNKEGGGKEREIKSWQVVNQLKGDCAMRLECFSHNIADTEIRDPESLPLSIRWQM